MQNGIPTQPLGPEATPTPRFPLGRVVATPGAVALLAATAVSPLALLARHLRGDWGDVDAHDSAQNEIALLCGFRILSAYTLPPTAPDGDKSNSKVIWVITEADRSVTTLLLPDEY